jgi:hypothetical protein
MYEFSCWQALLTRRKFYTLRLVRPIRACQARTIAMPDKPRMEPCPDCGKLVSVRAETCPFCDAELYEDDDDDRPLPRKRSGDVEAVDFLVPTNVSAWSILSCYLGLIGFCLPFVGMVFAIPAVIFGIIALRQRKKRKQPGTYGAVTSDIRAIVGLVLGGLAIVGYGTLIVLLATGVIK